MTGCENKNIILKAYAWDGEKGNSKARVSMDWTVLTRALRCVHPGHGAMSVQERQPGTGGSIGQSSQLSPTS